MQKYYEICRIQRLRPHAMACKDRECTSGRNSGSNLTALEPQRGQRIFASTRTWFSACPPSGDAAGKRRDFDRAKLVLKISHLRKNAFAAAALGFAASAAAIVTGDEPWVALVPTMSPEFCSARGLHGLPGHASWTPRCCYYCCCSDCCHGYCCSKCWSCCLLPLLLMLLLQLLLRLLLWRKAVGHQPGCWITSMSRGTCRLKVQP